MKVQRSNKLAQLLVQIQLSLVSSPWVNTKTEYLDVFELERGDPESIRSTRCHELSARYVTIFPNRQFDIP